MYQTVPPHPHRRTTTFVLSIVSLCLLALFLALAFNLKQPISLTVDGVKMKVRAGTTVAELQSSGAISSHAGRVLSIKGAILGDAEGEPVLIERNGRSAASNEIVFDGDVLMSSSGADSTEATVAVREPIPMQTRIQGTGPVMQLASPGSVGVREAVLGAVSRDVVSSRTVTPEQPMVVLRVRPSPTDKLIALTFDDGPWPGHTEKILQILKAEKVHATFFMVGIRVKLSPGLARLVVADGNLVGNHTLSHRELTKNSAKEVKHQIMGGADAIFRATGVRPIWFRPPYGSINGGVWKETRQLHLRVAMWDIDTRDWSRPGVKHIVTVAEKHASKGAIILMHDGGGSDRTQTIAALPTVIRDLKKRGFVFVTLQELADAH